MRAMVVLWWMNISQKSFRFTSKNWLQRYHQSCVYFYISEQGGMESGIFSEAPANRETLAITLAAQQLISIKICCKSHFSMVDNHALIKTLDST